MNENGDITPDIIDNSPGRELVGILKDQLKKSKEVKFAIVLDGFCVDLRKVIVDGKSN